jgi:hypothetical protein
MRASLAIAEDMEQAAEEVKSLVHCHRNTVTVTPAFTSSQISNGAQNLQRAGISRQTVVNWSKFYRDTAFYDVGNEAAAFRSYYLEQIIRAW